MYETCTDIVITRRATSAHIIVNKQSITEHVATVTPICNIRQSQLKSPMKHQCAGRTHGLVATTGTSRQIRNHAFLCFNPVCISPAQPPSGRPLPPLVVSGFGNLEWACQQAKAGAEAAAAAVWTRTTEPH